MPMDFPDLMSLQLRAKLHKFREIKLDEDESDYRDALVVHVMPIDPIEAGEIKFKVGWDKWTDEQKRTHLIDMMLNKV